MVRSKKLKLIWASKIYWKPFFINYSLDFLLINLIIKIIIELKTYIKITPVKNSNQGKSWIIKRNIAVKMPKMVHSNLCIKILGEFVSPEFEFFII